MRRKMDSASRTRTLVLRSLPQRVGFDDEEQANQVSEAKMAYSPLDDHHGSSTESIDRFSYLKPCVSFSNTMKNKLLMEDHLSPLYEHLIEAMCTFYGKDHTVRCSPVDEVGDDQQPTIVKSCINDWMDDEYKNNEDQEESVESMVREFVASLPLRYVLSIDCPGEALIHMRCVKDVKKRALDTMIHIKELDANNTLTFSTTGANNLKVVFICCSHTIGLMEFLMGHLVAGGNEIFDVNYLLSSDKIMLIRCVINLIGVTCFENLKRQLSSFIRAARGVPYDFSMTDELPLTSKIGPIDTSTVNHQTLAETIVGTKEVIPMIEKFDLPRSLSDAMSLKTEYIQPLININDRTENFPESTSTSLTSLFDVEDQQFKFLHEEGCFGDIMIDGAISKTTGLCIYKGQSKRSSQCCALKVFLKEELGSSNLLDLILEAKMAKELEHENICRFFGAMQSPTHICMAYEFCSKGPLSRIIGDKSIAYDYLPIAKDICNGMAYLHSKSIIHRDLKPDNILVDSANRVKIADFGLSVTHTGCEELTGETGTYRWMAPEVICHEPYSINSDIYSFALVLWTLLSREVPFDGLSPIEAASSTIEGIRPQIPFIVPEYISRIISSCWEQEQLKRPSFAHVSLGLSTYASVAAKNDNINGADNEDYFQS